MNDNTTRLPELVRDMGLDDTNVRRRWTFVGLEDDDTRRISRLASLMDSHVGEFTESFFGYLENFADAETLLRDSRAVERARELKREHLRAMILGPYDATYAQQRIELALVYSAAGLSHNVFLGGFRHMMSRIGSRIIEYADDPTEGFRTYLSLQKVAFFDIGLIGDVLTFERQRVIRQQQEAIRALSTPVLTLRHRLLLLPLVGIVDGPRMRQLRQQILGAIPGSRGEVVVLDITGTAAVDNEAADELVRTVSTARLMGAHVIMTGVSSEMARELVALGVDLRRLDTIGDLQGGIERAELLLERYSAGDSPWPMNDA